MAIFWVDPTNGSDHLNDGLTKASPKLTFQSLSSVVADGDTIRFVDGIHEINAGNKGTNANFSDKLITLEGETPTTKLEINYDNIWIDSSVAHLNNKGFILKDLLIEKTLIGAITNDTCFYRIIGINNVRVLNWDAAYFIAATLNTTGFISADKLSLHTKTGFSQMLFFYDVGQNTLSNCSLYFAGNNVNPIGLSGVEISNSIVYGNGTANTNYSNNSDTCFWNFATYPTLGSGSIIANPLFIDAENGILDLAPSSPCKQFGANANWWDNNTKWLQPGASGSNVGTYDNPFNSFASVAAAYGNPGVSSGDTIGIKNGTYSVGNPAISSAVDLRDLKFKAETFKSVVLNSGTFFQSVAKGVQFHDLVINLNGRLVQATNGSEIGDKIFFIHCQINQDASWMVAHDVNTDIVTVFNLCEIKNTSPTSLVFGAMYSKWSNCTLAITQNPPSGTVQEFTKNIVYSTVSISSVPGVETNNMYYSTHPSGVTATVHSTSVKNVNPLFIDQANGIYDLAPSSPAKQYSSAKKWYELTPPTKWWNPSAVSNGNGDTIATAYNNITSVLQNTTTGQVVGIVNGTHTFASQLASNVDITRVFKAQDKGQVIFESSYSGYLLEITNDSTLTNNYKIHFDGIVYKNNNTTTNAFVRIVVNSIKNGELIISNCKSELIQILSPISNHILYFVGVVNTGSGIVGLRIDNSLIYQNSNSGSSSHSFLFSGYADINNSTFIIGANNALTTGLIIPVTSITATNSIFVDESNVVTNIGTISGSNNCFYRQGGSMITSITPNSITSNPLFIDAANGIYDLAPNSPAKGRGAI